MTIDKKQKLLDKISKHTLKRIGRTIQTLPYLEGSDRALALTEIYSLALNDLGLLEKHISKEDFSDVIDTVNLARQWEHIPDVQKYIRIGTQITSLASKHSNINVAPVANTLALANIGYSQYQMINNFSDYNTPQKIVSMANTINNVGTAYDAFTPKALEKGSTIAAKSLIRNIDINPIQAAGYIAAAYGAYTLVDKFGMGGADGRKIGAASGAAMGTAVLPGIGTAIGTVIGLAVGSVNNGKSVEQSARDNYRTYFKELGIFSKSDNSHRYTLPNGSVYDVGVDGSAGRAMFAGTTKTFADPTKILQRDESNVLDNGELKPYDVDYTNDLDFFANHGLTALKYVLGGGGDYEKKSTEFGQMFGYMTNAATSNTSDRSFSKGNFDKTMQNVRSMYAKAGITNTEQINNILTQLHIEGKLTDTQLDLARQGVRTTFNNDYDYATQLTSTRHNNSLSTVGDRNSFVLEGETKKTVSANAGIFGVGEPATNASTVEIPEEKQWQNFFAASLESEAA